MLDPKGRSLGQAGLGNRKDIRNAVEAASKATGWGAATAHNRAQVLYYIAENLDARAAEFAERLRAMTGANSREAREEVDASIRRLFFYAGFADKYDGAVHATQKRFVTLAMNEPWGVMGIVCPDEAPLLAFVSLVAPAIAMGNAVVVVAERGASAGGDRFLFRARHLGRARRRRQHRHRRGGRAGARRWPNTTASTRIWHAGSAEGDEGGGGSLGGQPQGDLDAGRGRGLARRPKARVSAPRDAR